MPTAPRIKPGDLFTPREWAPFQSRRGWIGPLLVAHCWSVIGLAVFAGSLWPVLIPVCVMIIGTRQLGLLFTQGLQLQFMTPILVGIALCLLLAAALDTLIVRLVHLSTPWMRRS